MAGSARDQAALLPPAPGVYRFRDASGRVLYLGRATSLRSRAASYWGDLGDRAHLRRMVPRIAKVEAVACDSVHALAAVRGVTDGDRVTLAGYVAAVLGRDPAAVARLQASLTQRRAAAAGNLAFELAAKLQQEIEAVDWVTAEQKVTRQDPADHEVCGWSDGTLVRFAVRGGRLSGWTQRACGEPAARAHLARTPPEWAPFARRNAELAARLSVKTKFDYPNECGLP